MDCSKTLVRGVPKLLPPSYMWHTSGPSADPFHVLPFTKKERKEAQLLITYTKPLLFILSFHSPFHSWSSSLRKPVEKKADESHRDDSTSHSWHHSVSAVKASWDLSVLFHSWVTARLAKISPWMWTQWCNVSQSRVWSFTYSRVVGGP